MNVLVVRWLRTGVTEKHRVIEKRRKFNINK